MSFGFVVSVNSGGASVTSWAGNLPDGQFEVSGWHDGDQVTLSVEQRDASGRYVERATHVKPAVTGSPVS